MHFLDAWTTLPAGDFARRVAPLVCVLLAVLMPGPRAARAVAFAMAALVPFTRELDVGFGLGVLWFALWLVVGWQAGVRRGEARVPLSVRLGGLESGAVGLLIGGALLALLVAAVARLDIPAEWARRAAVGAALVVLGWIHLMLRRHVLRASLAFAAIGMGMQVLVGAARASLIPLDAPPRGLVLPATAVAVALAVRLAHARQAATGNAWVSDAHDLGD